MKITRIENLQTQISFFQHDGIETPYSILSIPPEDELMGININFFDT